MQSQPQLIPAIETFDLSSTVGPPASFCIAPTDPATRSRPVGAVSSAAAVKANARRYQIRTPVAATLNATRSRCPNAGPGKQDLATAAMSVQAVRLGSSVMRRGEHRSASNIRRNRPSGCRSEPRGAPDSATGRPRRARRARQRLPVRRWRPCRGTGATLRVAPRCSPKGRRC